jgi:hypothetical protein
MKQSAELISSIGSMEKTCNQLALGLGIRNWSVTNESDKLELELDSCHSQTTRQLIYAIIFTIIMPMLVYTQQ